MVRLITAQELREKARPEIIEQLAACELEYQRVLQQKHSHSAEPEDIRTARKNITRCKHIIHEKKTLELVEEFKGRRFIPKELRPKLNKGLRMALSPKQKRAMCRRQAITAAKNRLKIFSYQE